MIDIEELKRDVTQLPNCSWSASTVLELITRLEAAEQDAARYQYLRSRDSNKDYCDQCWYDGLSLRTGHLLDCHIDAAMKETK